MSQLTLLPDLPAESPPGAVDFHGITPPADLAGVPVHYGRSYLPHDVYRWRHPETGAALSRAALAVASYLDSIAGRKWCFTWQTDDKIAEGAGLSHRAAQMGLAELNKSPFVRITHQDFRGKVRRITWLLWKIPETLPALDAEGARDSAKPCATDSAKPCAGRPPSKRKPLRPDSARACAPLPYSNSDLGSNGGENVTFHAGAPTRGEPERQPDPEPVPPPPEPTPEPEPVRPPAPAPPDPGPDVAVFTPESVAAWEATMADPRLPEKSPAKILAKIGLASYRKSLANPALPNLTPRITTLAALLPAPKPPEPPRRAETEDLIRRAIDPAAGPGALDEAAGRLCEKWCDWGSRAGFRARLGEVRAGAFPPKLALGAYRKACSPTANRPGAVFMSVFAEYRETRAEKNGRRPGGASNFPGRRPNPEGDPSSPSIMRCSGEHVK